MPERGWKCCYRLSRWQRQFHATNSRYRSNGTPYIPRHLERCAVLFIVFFVLLLEGIPTQDNPVPRKHGVNHRESETFISG